MISTSLIINIFEVRLYEKTQRTHKLILIYLLICHEKHYINELKHQILNPISKTNKYANNVNCSYKTYDKVVILIDFKH